MAIVSYICDVCDRKLDVPQNKKGLEVIQRCTITSGCRGKLSQIKYQPDFIRGEYPEAVNGLDDWSQRKLLYTHPQSVKRDTWNVIHNLGVFPSVQVFVEVPTAVASEALTNLPCEQRNYRNTTTELIEVEPLDIQTISVNEIAVTFDIAQSGVVQCLARSSKPIIINRQADVIDLGIQPFQLSHLAELSVATVNSNATMSIKVKFIAPSGIETSVVYEGIDRSPTIGKSPWSAAGGGVYIDGVKYQTRSFDLGLPGTEDYEVSEFTTDADDADSLDGTYITISSPSVGYYFWINTSGGSAVDPAPAGKTLGGVINITTNDSADDVAAAIQAVVDGHGSFTATVSTNVVTVTSVVIGNTTRATNGDTEFTTPVVTSTYGISYDPITIEIGSSFYIEELDGVAFDELNFSGNELLFLLAGTPYAVFDKVSDSVVNPFGIGVAEAITSFYFDGTEAFVYDNLIQKVYPSIRVL